jgi:cell division protein FtsN
MQKDYDEYDGASRSSAISWMVMLVAALGFLALGWFAFNATENSGLQAEVITLESYQSAYKFEPEDKGGMRFAHQDKTIYDALDGTQRSRRVEKLFPEPEAPILPMYAGDDEAEEVVNLTAEKAKINKVAKAPKARVIKKKAPIVTVKKAVKKVAAKPIAKTVIPKKAPVKIIPKITAKKPVISKGKYALQLGAFTSEKDAASQWQKLRVKYSDILGNRGVSIQRADLAKGTFYRLRAAGFSSKAAAASACKKLSQKGQPCFAVSR